ncbi:hypothetical protein BH11PLA2_BH11PLA2_37450 [soil metagenome]
MIEVPFQLSLREAAKADAFLLLSPCNLMAACAELKLPQLPGLFAVAGGVLIVPSVASTFEPNAVIRLRRLGGHFYLPADADLSPGLLPDEISSLTRQQGLIVLPGGDVLAFDPKSPMAVRDWLACPRVVREPWQPFPPRTAWPDKLTRIERPSDAPAAVIESLNAGRPDNAQPLDGPGEAKGPIPEAARPPSASLRKRIGAGMTLAAANALAAAGKLLQNPKLAQLGGKLARKALEQVPRLSEKILGAQEAALRNILKQLQAGNIEDALRRAPAAVGDPDTPARVDTSNRLATKDPRYSLRNLLGSGSAGGASVWLGGGDVWLQLAAEYRRLAQEALKRGDFRRAAYLYGVLLRDLRSAANALAVGGLHRDAAVLYRDKLHDPLAAAQQFERAGDIDEAVRIYERLEKYEVAAELLRSVGDEERATDYFLRAAMVHADCKRWVAAGDLVRQKLGRRDLARDYYRSGWDGHGAEAIACGERLIDEHILAEEWDDVKAMAFDAATDRLLPPRASDAGRFFNYALKCSEGIPSPLAANLRDTARGLFAEHLRTTSNSPHLAG